MQSAGSEDWPCLDREEMRVLGVLVEKAKTTPEQYPLSINSLVTGCNQKSNRDPVMSLNDLDVEETLERCQKKRLVIRVVGSGRVERWRHNLYEAWSVEKVELAILAELLLRGAQTEGELRGRANRMESIEDLDTLRAALRPLVERKLVVYLTPPERRGAMLTHGFHEPREYEVLRNRAAVGVSSSPGGGGPALPPRGPVSGPAQGMKHSPGFEQELASSSAWARTELAALKQMVGDLQTSLDALREEFEKFKQTRG